MKPKKIIYVITKSNWGGAQRYVFDLATHLPKSEFEILVVTGNMGTLTKKLEENEIRVTSVNSLKRDVSFFDEMISFFKILKIFIKEKPDIIHLNSSKAGGIGALAGRIAGIKKIIFTAHGWPFKEDRNVIAKSLIYALSWLTVFLSHQTIVVSKQDEALGEKMQGVKRKINYIPVIPVGIDPKKILSKELAEKILFVDYPNIDSHVINSIKIVTIAELTKNKGLNFGIDMMNELEEQYPEKYTYTIFGTGEYRSALVQQAQKLLNSQGKPIVLFRDITATNMPYSLSTDASMYLRAFDIFILPSIKEGTPYVLLEAAAAGLPIVATDAVKSIESLIPNIHIVQSKSGAALAKKVKELTSKLTQSPHTITYTFEKMLSETNKLYKV